MASEFFSGVERLLNNLSVSSLIDSNPIQTRAQPERFIVFNKSSSLALSTLTCASHGGIFMPRLKISSSSVFVLFGAAAKLSSPKNIGLRVCDRACCIASIVRSISKNRNCPPKFSITAQYSHAYGQPRDVFMTICVIPSKTSLEYVEKGRAESSSLVKNGLFGVRIIPPPLFLKTIPA